MSIVYNIEQPNSNNIKYGMLCVEGWAFSTTSTIKYVEVKVNGKPYLINNMLKREDVQKVHAGAPLNSGFNLVIDGKKENLSQHLIVNIIISDGFEQLKLAPLYIECEELNKYFYNNLYWFFHRGYAFCKDRGFHLSTSDIRLGISKLKRLWHTERVESNVLQHNLSSYCIWLQKNTIGNWQKKLMSKQISQMKLEVLISVVMPAYKSDINLLREAIESVQCQIYHNWELIVVDDGTPNDSIEKFVKKYIDTDKRIRFYKLQKNSNISVATNEGVAKANGNFVFLMDHDDLLTADALFEVAACIGRNNNVDIIYSDDDKISMDGCCYDPQFKPDYSPELLLSYMYFSHIFCVRKSCYYDVGGCRQGYEGSQDYDLALRLTEKTNNIIHIPKILYHWRSTPTSTAFSADTKPESIIRGMRAVEDAVQRRNIPAIVYQPDFAINGHLGIFALQYSSHYNPLISIVIPTKNHCDVLRRCIDSIEHLSSYTKYEIIIVDNYSDDKNTLSYLDTICNRHKIIKVNNINGKFNFSHMVNEGVKNSNGDYVILLNNDTEVISENWLECMLAYMCISGVGIVGAKLLYPDKKIQHAGVVMKMFNGVAGHAFKLLPFFNNGYLSYASVARNYSAVTGACLMVKKSIYQEVSGFDEENFGVSFNDVDFCMKVRKKGYRVVYSPGALLYHYEGKSRGTEQVGYFSDAKETYEMTKKWSLNSYYNDPYYNVNLSLDSEKFDINAQARWISRKVHIKIALLTHNLNYEGAPLMQFNISCDLLQKGYSFFVLSPTDGPLREEYEKHGIIVYIMPDLLVRKYADYSIFKEKLNVIAEKLRKLCPDLIFTNTIEMFHGVTLANMMNLPVLWAIHESTNYKTYFNLDGKIITSFLKAYQQATIITFVAHATANLYRDLLAYNSKIIKNGIDIEKVENYKENVSKDELRKCLNISNSTIVISIVGTVCQRKGQKIFIDAANNLVKAGIKNVKFLIIGAKPSSYLEEMKTMILELKLEKYIDIIPATKDVYRYYVLSDLFVCASYEESSPQIILEAMAFKVPIISTDVFGIPELVQNGREAILVKPGDAKAICEALQKVIKNRELSELLKYNAYYKVKTYFTNVNTAQKYDDAFQKAYQEGTNAFTTLLIKERK